MSTNKAHDAAARLPGQAMDLISAITHSYRSQRFRTLKAGEDLLTPLDGKVLNFFDRRPGATLSDLAAHSGRDKAQLARLLRGLREQGLLQAVEDLADRRNVRLQLTEKGEELQSSVREQTERINGQALRRVSRAELEALVALLGRIKDNLGEAPEGQEK